MLASLNAYNNPFIIFTPVKSLIFYIKNNYLLIAILSLCTTSVNAQLEIDTSLTAEQLVKKLVNGQGVIVGNITVNGPHQGYGMFTNGIPYIGIDSGLIMCTGSVYNAIGENDLPYKTGYFTDPKIKKKPKGDKDLNRICHGITGDVEVIEFDFIPMNNKILFNYVFGSEEYPEYVGSKYNDVFAFIVNGEKVKRLNIAIIQGINLPVSINTLNDDINSFYYVDNNYFTKVDLKKKLPQQGKHLKPKKPNQKPTGKTKPTFKISKSKKKKLDQDLVNNMQYDGFTTVMTAECYVVPYKKYHMKIAIGDVGDYAYDSGVFLEDGSFISVKDPDQPKFKDYPDLSNKLNFDSLLAGKTTTIQQTKQDSIDQAEQDRFTVTNINFASASYIIPDTSKTNLDALADYLQRHHEFKIELTGYTDNVGSKKYNQNLSENRANAVMNYLIDKGVSTNRIKIAGYNFEDPIGDNTNEQGRAANRRVEIILMEDE